jgi:hypothetical protein
MPDFAHSMYTPCASKAFVSHTASDALEACAVRA